MGSKWAAPPLPFNPFGPNVVAFTSPEDLMAIKVRDNVTTEIKK